MTPLYQPEDDTAYVAEAMQTLEGGSLQPIPYTLVLVTVIETKEELAYFLRQNVQLHYSRIDGKWRKVETVEKEP